MSRDVYRVSNTVHEEIHCTMKSENILKHEKMFQTVRPVFTELQPTFHSFSASYHIVLAPCSVVVSYSSLGNTSGPSHHQIQMDQGLGRRRCCYETGMPFERVIAIPCWPCVDYRLHCLVVAVPCWQEVLECWVGHNPLGGR